MRSLQIFSTALLLSLAVPRLHGATYVIAQRESKATDDGPGSLEKPWKTIARATANVGPGDLVVIKDGIYREVVVVKAAGTSDGPIRFESAPGAQVVITGADRLTGWKQAREGQPIYQINWPHQFVTWSKHMTHPDDAYHRLIGRCEQVSIENYLLRQVLETNQLAPGTFCADISQQLLWVWDAGGRDLNKLYVEGSVRQELLRVEGNHVQIRGIHFRMAANMAQHGAVVLAGAGDVLEDCVIEAMNASGATFAGPDQIVRRCVFRDNGQIGFGANAAHQLLFTECLVENNNTKGFDRGWEAGGDKLVLSRNAVLERSRFIRNRGNGIWFDIGNENCTVRECLVADNEDAGIFYEISFGLQAHDNVIAGNGFAQTPGAWGAQAGISLSSSPGCTIERNLILGNREGFNFREQSRTTPRIGNRTETPVWNHDQLIQNNIIAFNRDAQIWGWFDMKDARHWPAGESNVQHSQSTASSEASDATHPHQGLTLEKLNLRFAGNVYFAAPGKGLFEWGVTWGRHSSYPTLQEFRNGLRIDSDSQVLDPGFFDIRASDYRLRVPMMKSLVQNYPRGTVPGVTLGVRP